MNLPARISETANAAVRLEDITKLPVSLDQCVDMQIRAALQMSLYDALVRAYGRAAAWERYLNLGGSIRFDAHGDPWILVEVT